MSKSEERDPREAFSRLADKRLKMIAQNFKLLRNLANPYNYKFTPEDLSNITKNLEEQLQTLKKAYAKFSDSKLKEATGSIVEKAKAGVEESVAPPPVKSDRVPDDEIPEFLKKKA